MGYISMISKDSRLMKLVREERLLESEKVETIQKFVLVKRR